MKQLLISPQSTIRQSMKQLGKVGERCLVVVDASKKLIGTLSDGDIRKAILNGYGFSEKIISICQKNPKTLIKGKYDAEMSKKIFIKERYDLIPVINDDETLVDILFIESVINENSKHLKTKLDLPTVIMAGGRGARLEPFTKILPKPLIPVHEKPIIEHIIQMFTDVGCNNFYLTINYMSKILKAYFEELNPNYKINFLEEKIPLGTAGSLSYVEGKINSPFFVTNCDIIVKTDYSSLYKFHVEGNYDLTLVASAKEYVIPYGTCELNNDGHLAKINEKPQFDFLINTGLYILNPKVLSFIKKNQVYHITHLIEDLRNNGIKVGVFPIDDDDWIDVGQWAEYKKAIDKL